MATSEHYVSLYRKYRPVTFDGVVGQETIVRILKGSLDTGRTSHAYLFTGPKGTGKTTVARIFAKALNCEKGPTSHPCMECEHCLAITAGTDVDVFEMDAASNRRIEDMRALLEATRFVPARSRKRVFIIDEAHMLTPAAFDALLKTLEEPPDYLVFILATTEPQKLPETIVSRCQRFDFRKIPETAMLHYLQSIRDKEAPRVTDDALHQMVTLSGGSMRGAIGLVDQFSVFGDEAVVGATVLDLLGLPTDENLGLLIEALLLRNPKGTVAVLDQLERSGIEPADLLERSIGLISEYLLAKVSNGSMEQPGSARRFSGFTNASLVGLSAVFARLQQQSAYLSDPYPLVRSALLAIALDLPITTDDSRVGEARTVQFMNQVANTGTATTPAAESMPEKDEEPSSEPVIADGVSPETNVELSEQWNRFKAVVAESSNPIGVMLQALDIRQVGVLQDTLTITLGPKARLFKPMLEQKQQEVLVPAARTVYGATGLRFVDAETENFASQEGGENATDDKLELLKSTFDATESLFGS